jgi:Ca2+-binding EF-hand superfamily protein
MYRLKKVLKPFFKKYDCDGNGNLDRHELSAVFHDLGALYVYVYALVSAFICTDI